MFLVTIVRYYIVVEIQLEGHCMIVKTTSCQHYFLIRQQKLMYVLFIIVVISEINKKSFSELVIFIYVLEKEK